MGARRARTVEVKPVAQERYNAELQAAMSGKVWLAYEVEAWITARRRSRAEQPPRP